MVGAAQSEGNQTSTSTFSGVSQDILLVGTLQSGSKGDMPGAPGCWMVRVDEVLSGPMPCSNEIKVTTQSSPGRGMCSMTLYGSEGYYIRKVDQGTIDNAITDTDVATGTNAATGTDYTDTANEINAMKPS